MKNFSQIRRKPQSSGLGLEEDSVIEQVKGAKAACDEMHRRKIRSYFSEKLGSENPVSHYETDYCEVEEEDCSGDLEDEFDVITDEEKEFLRESIEKRRQSINASIEAAGDLDPEVASSFQMTGIYNLFG